jgi:hypothetical protein
MGNTRRIQWSTGGQDILGKNGRQMKKWRGVKVKLRSVVGVIVRKQDLRCAMLNVDGLSHSTLEDVRQLLARRKPDVCIILETKRRQEEIGIDISVEGYSLTEIRRSDSAGDKGGGGIAYYTRLVDGLVNMLLKFQRIIAIL